MNNRFLFRGKSCVGNWVYGYLKKQLVGNEPDVWAIQSENREHPCKYTASPLYENVVDPATLGQCTGLRDKTGKLIFEGDIVIPDHWDSAPIVWEFNGWHLDYPDSYEPISDGRGVTVIGNIHDNQEILEVQ